MTIIEIIKLAIPMIFGGGVLGYFLKALFEKRNERESREFIKKEQQYKNFLKLAVEGFFEGWKKEGKDKDFLKELNTNALLYASDNVLEKAYNFQYCFDRNKSEFPKEESDKYFKELVISIRE